MTRDGAGDGHVAAPPAADGGGVTEPGTGLRTQALRGGAYVTVRQVAGSGLRFLGLLVVTRLIGPGPYGAFVGALAVAGVIGGLANLGIDAFLLRSEDEPEREVEEQATTLLLLAGGVAAVGTLGLVGLLSGSVLRPEFAGPLAALAALPLLNNLRIPAIARLERSFRYRSLTVVELGGDLTSYAVAIPLALTGAGVWAPTCGALVGAVVTVVASLWLTGLRPRLRWSPPIVSRVLRYGVGYAASSWVFSLHDLVSPLIVGRYAGPTGVAHVALTVKFVDTMAIVKRATSRLAMVVLAKVQRDPERLAIAQAEGTVLQLLGTGPLLGGFSLVAPLLVPAILGDEWRPSVELYPLLALNVLVGTLFNLHTSALHVLGRNIAVVRLRVAQVLIVVVTSAVLVPWIGVIGYGVAEALRASSFAVLHLQVRRLYRPRYREALPWLVALVPPLFAAWLEPPWGALLLLPAAGVLAVPGPRRSLAAYAALARRSLAPRRAAAGT